MNKPGRPRNSGLQNLTRDTRVLYGYQQAREAGQKHTVAVLEAIRYVREKSPKIRISATEVKRILARYRSSKLPYGCVVIKPTPGTTITLPNGVVVRTGLTVCVAPRIGYPRANAAEASPRG